MFARFPLSPSIFFLLKCFLVLGGAPLCLVAQQTQEESSKRIPIRIESSRTADGLFGYQQDIIVDGRVNGNLSGINCNIHIKGTVNGNISVIGGSVTIYREAEVTGNLVCFGGRLQIHPDLHLPGKIAHFFDPDEHRTENAFARLPAQASAFLARSLFLFLLIVITFYVFPNQIHEASFQMSQDYVRPLILGVVTIAAFAIGLFLSFLLMVVGIGYLLFLLFFCGLVVVATFGTVIVFYRLSHALEEWTRNRISGVFAMLTSVLLMGSLMYVPFINMLIILGFLVLGSGVVIETRFGTNKQWFTKRARFWSAH